MRAHRIRHEIDSRPPWAAIFWAVILATFAALSIAPILAADPPQAGHAAEPIRITRDGLFKQRPAWAPDGNLLAFSRNRAANNFVFLSKPHGADERRLARRTATADDADGSPEHT